MIKLRRNFGQTSALAVGFDHASGEYIISMDGDLQHAPNDIPRFIKKLAEDYDVVSGWPKDRIDNFVMRRIPSRCANWLMAILSGVCIHTLAQPSRPIAASHSTARVYRSLLRCHIFSRKRVQEQILRD